MAVSLRTRSATEVKVWVANLYTLTRMKDNSRRHPVDHRGTIILMGKLHLQLSVLPGEVRHLDNER